MIPGLRSLARGAGLGALVATVTALITDGPLARAADSAPAVEKAPALKKTDGAGPLEKKLRQLENQRRYREAIELAERELPAIEPTAELLFTLTRLYYAVDDFVAMARWARATLALDPTHEKAARHFLIACRETEDFAAGIEVGTEWIRRNANGSDIYKDLALLVHDSGDLPRAYGFSQEALKRKPFNARVAGVHVYFVCQVEGAPAGLAFAEEWTAKHKPDEFFWAQLGKGLKDADAFAEAEPYLRRALAEGSDDDGVAECLLVCFRHRRAADDARQFAEEYLRDHQPRALWWNTLTAVYYEADDFDAALVTVRRARELDPLLAGAVSNLLNTLNEKYRHLEAIDEGQRWLALPKARPTGGVFHALGNAWYGISHYAEALPLYRAALVLEPDNVAHAREIVLTLDELGRDSEAVAFGDEWQRAHPTVKNDSFTSALAGVRSGK